MFGNLLTSSERTDLEIIFKDKNFKKHYNVAQPIYKKWAELIANIEIPLLRGGKYKFSALEGCDQLTILIKNYDGKLKELIASPGTPASIYNMGHEHICKLFAKKILADGEVVSKK